MPLANSDLRSLSTAQLDLLKRILENIISNPDEGRFRRLSKRSAEFQRVLCDGSGRVLPNILMVLKDCGFVDLVDDLQCEEPALIVIQQYKQTLEELTVERDSSTAKPLRIKSAFDFERRSDSEKQRKEAELERLAALEQRREKYEEAKGAGHKEASGEKKKKRDHKSRKSGDSSDCVLA